jgi:hypothetical protein
MLQNLNLDNFANNAELWDGFWSMVNKAIDNGWVSCHEKRLKSRSSLRALAGITFYFGGKETSIVALIADKNGFDSSEKLVLRGGDFTGLGADFVESLLRKKGRDYILPAKAEKPVATKEIVENARGILASCGL